MYALVFINAVLVVSHKQEIEMEDEGEEEIILIWKDLKECR